MARRPRRNDLPEHLRRDSQLVGALADLLAKLAEAKINITATDAVCAGADRFGMILWVKPRDVKRAAKAFGIA